MEMGSDDKEPEECLQYFGNITELNGYSVAETSREATRYLPLAKSIASQVHERIASHLDLEELTRFAIRGLERATSDFRTRQGTTFRTYLSYRIRAEVLNELNGKSWPSLEQKRQYQFARKSNELLLYFTSSAEGTIKRSLAAEEQELKQLLGLLAVLALLIWKGSHQDHVDQSLQRGLDRLEDREKKFIQRYYEEDHSLEDASRITGFSTADGCRFHVRILENLARLFADKG